MLPFPRLVQYDNTVDNTWYSSPTTVIAYDSNKFNENGFTDYMGNTMRVGNNVFNIIGTSPSIGSGSPFYKGINLNTGYISTYKSDADGMFVNSWCLDMWVKQNVPVSGGVANGTVLFVNTNVSNQEYSTRFEIDFLSATQVYQNSGGPSYIGSVSTSDLISTTFYHLAIQYLNKRIYIFKDGVLRENFAFEISGTTWKDLSIIGNLGRGNPSTAYAVIDRYRLRTGQYFDISGFNPNNIYPGVKIS